MINKGVSNDLIHINSSFKKSFASFIEIKRVLLPELREVSRIATYGCPKEIYIFYLRNS